MNWWLPMNWKGPKRYSTNRRTQGRSFEVDIIGLHGSGTSFATPEVYRRAAKWLGNFPAEEQGDAARLLRNALVAPACLANNKPRRFACRLSPPYCAASG